MWIHLSEVLSAEGKEKTYTCEIGFNAFQTGNGSYPVTEKSPVSLKIVNLGEKRLLLSGRCSLPLSIPCDRCLEEVPQKFDIPFEREIDMNQTEEERIEDLDEQPYIVGFQLDVDRFVETELFLHMPMKVLCSDDCKGICDRCGANLNRETCGCSQEPKDPRMAAILDIFHSAADQ